METKVRPFPMELADDSTKNFFIGWCEQAVRNKTLTPENWNEGIDEALRFSRELKGGSHVKTDAL